MLMMAVAVMGGVTSCEEHTDEYDGSLRVGNILLADNSVVSPQGYDAEGKQAVGVIFYCNRDTALVISTHELGSYAYADSLGTVGSVDSDSRTHGICPASIFKADGLNFLYQSVNIKTCILADSLAFLYRGDAIL